MGYFVATITKHLVGYTLHGMRCCRNDWPGFVCFVVIKPRVLSANRVDFGFFFCFINIPILSPTQRTANLSWTLPSKSRKWLRCCISRSAKYLFPFILKKLHLFNLDIGEMTIINSARNIPHWSPLQRLHENQKKRGEAIKEKQAHHKERSGTSLNSFNRCILLDTRNMTFHDAVSDSLEWILWQQRRRSGRLKSWRELPKKPHVNRSLSKLVGGLCILSSVYWLLD